MSTKYLIESIPARHMDATERERVMSGDRASREKDSRTERAIVCLLQERGLAAERVPLSGAARGRFGGDIGVPVLSRDLRGEPKCRAMDSIAFMSGSRVATSLSFALIAGLCLSSSSSSSPPKLSP